MGSGGADRLGRENERLPVPIRTEFSLGDITYYFRKTIDIDADPAMLNASIRTMIDDGAVIYVNGQEVRRIGLQGGPVPFDRLSDRNVNEAEIEGPFEISNGPFVRGRNVIAVEVPSGDVWGVPISFSA